jgi:phosphoribosylformylglycinamidine (FGAM) synthase-like enzyme
MEYYFGEDQGRYLLEIEPKNYQKVVKNLNENNIFNEKIATVQKDKLEIIGELKLNIDDLYKINNTWYNNY